MTQSYSLGTLRSPKSRGLLFSVCGTILLLAACGGSGGPGPEPMRTVEVTDEAVATGQALFGSCMACHGEKAEGKIGVGPRIASESYLAAASDSFLLRTITNGRAGTTMVSWKQNFDRSQREALVAYLRSLYPVDPAQLDESPLRGEPAKGEVIFRDICSGCHGRSGAGYQETANGTGIGRRAFLDAATNGFLRHVVAHGKSQTGMKGFAEKGAAVANLTPAEIDDTIAYLRSNAW